MNHYIKRSKMSNLCSSCRNIWGRFGRVTFPEPISAGFQLGQESRSCSSTVGDHDTHSLPSGCPCVSVSLSWKVDLKSLISNVKQAMHLTPFSVGGVSNGVGWALGQIWYSEATPVNILCVSPPCGGGGGPLCLVCRLQHHWLFQSMIMKISDDKR